MGYCGVAETGRLIILTGCLFGNGVFFSGTVNQLSAPFVVKISHFSSTLWCGSSVVVFVVIYSLSCAFKTTRTTTSYTHHTQTKHNRMQQQQQPTAAATATTATMSAVNWRLWCSCYVADTAAKTGLRNVPKNLDGKDRTTRKINKNHGKKKFSHEHTNWIQDYKVQVKAAAMMVGVRGNQFSDKTSVLSIRNN